MQTNTATLNHHIQQLQPANITAKRNKFYKNPVNLQQFRKITRKLAGFAENLLYTLEVDVLQENRSLENSLQEYPGTDNSSSTLGLVIILCLCANVFAIVNN